MNRNDMGGYEGMPIDVAKLVAEQLKKVDENDERTKDRAARPNPEKEFIKFDKDKPEWDLVPWEAFEPVVDILTQGAKKYAPNNWQLCEDPKRYRDALMRHLMAYMKGELTDEESGNPHLSHVVCNALFLTWMDKQNEEG